MRLSSDPNDAAYRNPKERRAEITLNGKRIKNVLTADEELGEVTILTLGEGTYVPQTLRGEVTITILPREN